MNDFIKNRFYKIKKTIISKGISKIIEQYQDRDSIVDSSDTTNLESLFSFHEIPEKPNSAKGFLKKLKRTIIPFSIKVDSPNFMGHMTTSLPYFTNDIARLITALNQNVVKTETGLSATYIERQSISMMHHLMYTDDSSFYKEHIHNKESTLGIITSGGTIANLTALQCARNKKFPLSEKEGISLDNKGVIFCSTIGHYSLQKAMGLLGLGTDNLKAVPIDRQNKIRIDILEEMINQCIDEKKEIIAIVGVAGTTECGSIDPLEKLAEITKKYGIYYHVDAAWGGAIKFSKTYASLLSGIEKADSITIDGHKQLYLPMGLGLVLFKSPDTAKHIEKQSNYIIRRTSIDLGKRSIEGSRPANSLYLYATLQLLGRENYEILINNGIEIATKMAQYIKEQPDFELLVSPETNILLYRYIPNKYNILEKSEAINKELNLCNIQLQKNQREKGNSFVSYTTIESYKYDQQLIVSLRIVVANPQITFNHFLEMIKEQRELAKI